MDDLWERGYRNLTVLDISQRALDRARTRLGDISASIHWVCADVTQSGFPANAVDLWHDRAVFHFLLSPEERRAYVQAATQTLHTGGTVIISTFGPEGPLKCSGLEIVRYDTELLHQEFGPRFRLIESLNEWHQTPFGTMQQFLYCHYTLE